MICYRNYVCVVLKVSGFNLWLALSQTLVVLILVAFSLTCEYIDFDICIVSADVAIYIIYLLHRLKLL